MKEVMKRGKEENDDGIFLGFVISSSILGNKTKVIEKMEGQAIKKNKIDRFTPRPPFHPPRGSRPCGRWGARPSGRAPA